MKYSLFGSFTAKSNRRDELANILLSAAKILEENDGCFHYLVSTAPSEPDKVYIFESWTNKQAHDKSLEPQEIQQLIQQAMLLIESMDKQLELQLLGGKSK